MIMCSFLSLKIMSCVVQSGPCSMALLEGCIGNLGAGGLNFAEGGNGWLKQTLRERQDDRVNK